MKIIVTGGHGQLGSELKDLAKQHPEHDFVFTDRDDLDITDSDAVKEFFAKHQPHAVIHGAAYTAVDKAELEKEVAYAVNATATEYIAQACKAHNARLVMISTDYVFDGNGTEPYLPNHTTNPVNYYGYTKLHGEQAALSYANAVVIRTSWVYSVYGANFVKTMLRLMKEKPQLNVVNDQVGCPTYAKDLALAAFTVITHPNFVGGVHHFSNSGIINWFQFAQQIQATANLTNCVVGGIPSTQYPTPAKRPSYSAMNTESIQQTYQVAVRTWQDALQECMQALAV
jgi:dTDP-4-dehydrorhamnose reductase